MNIIETLISDRALLVWCELSMLPLFTLCQSLFLLVKRFWLDDHLLKLVRWVAVQLTSLLPTNKYRLTCVWQILVLNLVKKYHSGQQIYFMEHCRVTTELPFQLQGCFSQMEIGHLSWPTDPHLPWPTWSIQKQWPIWPMTHDPLTHFHICSLSFMSGGVSSSRSWTKVTVTKHGLRPQ